MTAVASQSTTTVTPMTPYWDGVGGGSGVEVASRDAILAEVLRESFAGLRDALAEAASDQLSPVNVAADQPTYPEGLSAFELLSSATRRCVEAGVSSSTDPRADSTVLWTALHGLMLLHPATPGVPVARRRTPAHPTGRRDRATHTVITAPRRRKCCYRAAALGRRFQNLPARTRAPV